MSRGFASWMIPVFCNQLKNGVRYRRVEALFGKNDQGEEKELDAHSVVSMNVWAFQPSVFKLWKRV